MIQINHHFLRGVFIYVYYRVQDTEEIRQFIQEHSFATVVSIRKGKPIATHVPLLLQQEGDDYYLAGHLAYGNPQWRTFEDGEVLVMFQGPHAYVSSSWYEQENVPTWNYQAVHIYGKASTFEGEALAQHLAAILEKYEKHRDNAVLWDTLSPETLQENLQGIVGIKIAVDDIQAAYKLSQNRKPHDYENIMKKLNEENDTNASAVAEAMKKAGLPKH